MEEYIEVLLPNKEGYTIYTKSNCIYCKKVFSLLQNKGVTFLNCDESLKKDKITFLEIMEEIIGYSYKTFPMVFKDGVFIGGYNETTNYLNRFA